MNTQTQEGAEVLSSYRLRPGLISKEQLELLKLKMAEKEGFERLPNGEFNKLSEEWIGMEEVIGTCYIGVFHHYKAENETEESALIFIISPVVSDQFQVWQQLGNDLVLVDQSEDVRNVD